VEWKKVDAVAVPELRFGTSFGIASLRGGLDKRVNLFD
jgi:hypothetical protein